ncbi:MAG TPA: hypothetical protein VLX59_11330, partial [Acidimicrobiales bacterium]|nr:hypothetical protein [Acidimicrobiales bacterium]
MQPCLTSFIPSFYETSRWAKDNESSSHVSILNTDRRLDEACHWALAWANPTAAPAAACPATPVLSAAAVAMRTAVGVNRRTTSSC